MDVFFTRYDVRLHLHELRRVNYSSDFVFNSNTLVCVIFEAKQKNVPANVNNETKNELDSPKS